MGCGFDPGTNPGRLAHRPDLMACDVLCQSACRNHRARGVVPLFPVLAAAWCEASHRLAWSCHTHFVYRSIVARADLGDGLRVDLSTCRIASSTRGGDACSVSCCGIEGSGAVDPALLVPRTHNTDVFDRRIYAGCWHV